MHRRAELKREGGETRNLVFYSPLSGFHSTARNIIAISLDVNPVEFCIFYEKLLK